MVDSKERFPPTIPQSRSNRTPLVFFILLLEGKKSCMIAPPDLRTLKQLSIETLLKCKCSSSEFIPIISLLLRFFKRCGLQELTFSHQGRPQYDATVEEECGSLTLTRWERPLTSSVGGGKRRFGVFTMATLHEALH